MFLVLRYLICIFVCNMLIFYYHMNYISIFFLTQPQNNHLLLLYILPCVARTEYSSVYNFTHYYLHQNKKFAHAIFWVNNVLEFWNRKIGLI